MYLFKKEQAIHSRANRLNGYLNHPMSLRLIMSSIIFLKRATATESRVARKIWKRLERGTSQNRIGSGDGAAKDS